MSKKVAKKVTSKKEVKKTSKVKTTEKVEKTPKVKKTSIREVIYNQFDKVGVNELKLDDALKIAQSVKSDTKFNKWHLYFYRKQYRAAHNGC